ncbi:MAG: hypothetical protein QOC96_2765 [Acidobacteriota bacterium]|nr:hypothetical protein [Acidobacteriota bacterium]
MTRLFIELYLDEDVNPLVAGLVRARGFVAQTTQETGRTRTGDAAQLAYAVSQQRAMLTHNRDDFARLTQEYFAAGRKHFGIIIAVRRPPQELVLRLMTILNQTTADEMEDQIIYI